ncbi:Ion transport protein-domain-containing protein [Scenedesmus sp. NREL 46B-D3]|nr:Ion transport protein-domain-containing protein [Scenedesmus sp. NREL 46B-D3]
MLLKVLAMGLVLAPGTYLRSGWNILDGAVVAMGYVDVLMSGSSVTALRAVRVLRPLRTITHIKGLRMFAGAMRYRCAAADFSSAYLDASSLTYQNVNISACCQTPSSSAVATWRPTYLVPSIGSRQQQQQQQQHWCITWSGGRKGGGWTCPTTSITLKPAAASAAAAAAAAYGMFCARFDNPNGGMTSFDNDAVSPWVLVYFVVLIVTGAFFLINLALAVLYLQFTKEFSVAPSASAAVTRSASLAAGQASLRLADLQAEPSAQQLAQMTADHYDDDSSSSSSSSNSSTSNRFSSNSSPDCLSGWFSLLSLLMIVANTAVMAAASYPMDPAWESASETLNISFTFYFAGELLLKLVGLGPRRYIRDRMNQFDALVVAASLAEVALLLAPGDDAGASSMSVLRTTRLMRVFKLARSWKELNRIITAVLRSFSQVCYLSLLLLLFVYIIALMGMQLFGHKFSSCGVGGAQQLCPPGRQRHECPIYPDCYVPCTESQAATWFSVPGSPYNGLAWCERFPRTDSLAADAATDHPGASAVEPLADPAASSEAYSYWAQVGKASVPDSRFDNIGWALLTTFQLVTTENWNNVMYSGMAATSPAAALWFAALAAPPAQPSQLPAASSGLGCAPTKFAVARSGGSVPRFSRLGGMPVSSGCGVEASGGSYSGALLQGNLTLLLARNAAAADALAPQCAAPAPGLPVASFSSGSMLPQEQRRGAVNARLGTLGGASAAAGMNSTGGHNDDPGASRCWSMVWAQQCPRSFSSNITLSGTSCCVLGPNNWLRQKLAQLVTHKQFENGILVLIFFSSIILALEMPSLDRDGLFLNTLEYIDMGFVVLFAVEALVKILVRGFVANGPGSYLRNPWNVLDFFIVVLGGLRALRTLRALRPLRVASRLEGMKVVVDALFASLPPLGNIVLVCLLFYLVFGIMGVHLLAGRMYSCQDPQGNLLQSEYVLPQGQHITREWWVNRVANFDNILVAILTLFQISTTELWVSTMYDGVAAVGIDQQPRDGHNPALAAFFVVFMIFGCFFVLQLFIATALEQFAKMHQEKGRRVLLTAQQEEWLTIQRMIAETHLRAVTSSSCELLVMAAIICNVLIMAATHADMSQGWQDFMSYANVGFTLFFTMEAVAKLLALGWKQYLRDAWCRFDLLVVLVSVAGVCVDLATPQNLEVLPLLRVLRLVRVFRLIPKAEGLRNLLQTLVFSLPALGNIGGVLLLFFFIYAVVGMNLFGGVKHGQFLDRHSNFSNVGMALVVLFRMITGESWNGIMQDCMVTSECIEVLQDVDVSSPAGQAAVSVAAGTWLDAGDALVRQVPADMLGNRCSPAPLAAVVYFCSFVLLCGLVLVNFVIGVIIDNMQSSNSSEDMPISRYHVERFTRAWSELDPTASQYIPAVELSSLLRDLPPPMGVRGEEGEQAKIQSIVMSVDIPIHKKNQVHFFETLHALAGRVAGTLVPGGEEDTVHRRLHPRLPLPPADPQDAPKYTVAHFYAALYVQAAVRGFLRRHALHGAGGGDDGLPEHGSGRVQEHEPGGVG